MPAFGRPRIGLDVEQLPPHEVAQPRLELGHIHPTRAGQRIGSEDLTEHRRILEERPIGGLEGIEPRGDQRAQRVRHRDVRQVADRLVRVAHATDAAVGEEAAHRLDCVQRHALGTPTIAATRRAEAGNHP